MISSAADLARRLARDAEAVCRHYLSNGRRRGRYWVIGDVHEHAGPQPLCAAYTVPNTVLVRPANGPTPRPASMAISST